MVIYLTLKKIKIFNVVIFFVLSFLWHFIYDLIPNFVTAIFFPVNESIWEHMKIIFGVIIFGSLISLILMQKFKIKYNNFYVEIVTKGILGVIFYLAIFIPLYNWLGENMFISIGLMLITYIVMEFIGYKILLLDELDIKILPIILIVLCYILFALLTFYPPHNTIFFDEIKLIYGIPEK